jgi:hypothetical protein
MGARLESTREAQPPSLPRRASVRRSSPGGFFGTHLVPKVVPCRPLLSRSVKKRVLLGGSKSHPPESNRRPADYESAGSASPGVHRVLLRRKVENFCVDPSATSTERPFAWLSAWLSTWLPSRAIRGVRLSYPPTLRPRKPYRYDNRAPPGSTLRRRFP